MNPCYEEIPIYIENDSQSFSCDHFFTGRKEEDKEDKNNENVSIQDYIPMDRKELINFFNKTIKKTSTPIIFFNLPDFMNKPCESFLNKLEQTFNDFKKDKFWDFVYSYRTNTKFIETFYKHRSICHQCRYANENTYNYPLVCADYICVSLMYDSEILDSDNTQYSMMYNLKQSIWHNFKNTVFDESEFDELEFNKFDKLLKALLRYVEAIIEDNCKINIQKRYIKKYQRQYKKTKGIQQY